MECKYCITTDELCSIADEWLASVQVEKLVQGPLVHGACINVNKKVMEINLVPQNGSDYGFSELSVIEVPIKYCPVCGREL